MKKTVFILLLAACVVFIAGKGEATIASNHREVEQLELIRTVGVDVAEDGNVTVTAGTGSRAAGGAPSFFQSTGSTVATAINDMQRLPLGKEALFAHTAHFILSRSAAETELRDCLDYIQRSPDMRLDTDIFILREGTAT